MNLLIVTLALAMINATYSPDSTKIAFTFDNDLFVKDCATGENTRITYDGSDVILNGYASWVYYEEIFGRPSNYKAFWWSPDSQKLAFYRFDNSRVPVFPIFSPVGQSGKLNMTRYPKAGQANPRVSIGIVDLANQCDSGHAKVVWADFNPKDDQYFGTPFWGKDSRNLFVQWEPRRQNELKLYQVSAQDGSKNLIYEDSYPTWLDWIDGMLFSDKGLYMVRDSATGWEQIYFLSYDGKDCRMLSSGKNWAVSLLRIDEKKGDLWFLAKRDNPLHPTLYRLDRKGKITALTNPDFWAKDVKFSADGKSFEATVSTSRSPWETISCDSYKGYQAGIKVIPSDIAVPVQGGPVPEIVRIQNEGFDLYGLMSLPENFDPSKKYPVVMQLYGGPGTPYVRDRWADRDASDRWCWKNGIIYIVVDPRTSGENGRLGMDQAFEHVTVTERKDYLAWVEWLRSLPYVNGKVGVEGFSFGGTTTAYLVLCCPEYFCCGIAGGGVYDWTLYDSHYTERFMNHPADNPDGYKSSSVLWLVQNSKYSKDYRPNSLMLTHGTGDDNVHFQNTLQLITAMQDENLQFELMIYPDGMHGYRGKQRAHNMDDEHDFWKRNLLDNEE